MRSKLRSLVAALLVGSTLSIPTSVSSQALVEFALSLVVFAGFSPTEQVTFVYRRIEGPASGDPVHFTLLLGNTSTGSNDEPCEASVETELLFAGASTNFFKVSFVYDGTQSLVKVGPDSIPLDSCFDEATSLFAAIGRTPPSGQTTRDRIFFNYDLFSASVSDISTGATRAIDRPFLMPIEDVFSISGRGTISFGFGEKLHLYFVPRPNQSAMGGGIFNNQGNVITLTNSTVDASTSEPCEASFEIDPQFPIALVNHLEITVIGEPMRIRIGDNESPLPACFNDATNFLVGSESNPEDFAPGLSLRAIGHRVAGAEGHTRDIGMVFQSYALYPHMSLD